MTRSRCRCPSPAVRRERRFPTARPPSRSRPHGMTMPEASTCERPTPIHRHSANSPTRPRGPNGCRSHTGSRSVRRNSIPRRDRTSSVLRAIDRKTGRRPRCCWLAFPMISAARAPILNWPGSGLTPCAASWSRSAPNATRETCRLMDSGRFFRLPATTLSSVGKRTAASRCLSCDEPKSCARGANQCPLVRKLGMSGPPDSMSTSSKATNHPQLVACESAYDAADDRRVECMKSVRVLSVASEIFPLIKTGGLADVTGALPIALKLEDIEVRTVVPGYPSVMNSLGPVEGVLHLPHFFGGDARLLRAKSCELGLFVLDAPHLFARAGNPYLKPDGVDWPDNALRFAALAR